MNLTPYELALIAGGFTIVGALVGAWIAFRNAISVYKLDEFNKAAAVFRCAFYPDIIYLKHGSRIEGVGHADNLSAFLLQGYLHRHLKAMETFKDFLSPRNRKGIDKEWQKYCCDHCQKERMFEQYSCKLMNKDTKTEELKQLALHRIENLLEFAKHK